LSVEKTWSVNTLPGTYDRISQTWSDFKWSWLCIQPVYGKEKK